MSGAFEQGTRQFAQATLIVAAILIGAWLLAQLAAQPDSQADLLTSLQFRFQDRWVAPIFLAACLIRPVPLQRPWAPRDDLIFLVCAGLALIVCTLGHQLVFQGFDLSRDEQMVSFDAAILQSGHLIAPLPSDWREFAAGFNRTFILDIGNGEAWVSAYLPVNAAIHAAFGSLGLISFVAPVMVAAGGFFLWKISRQLWPDSAATRTAVIVFYFTSSQVVLTGMTKFSMSAHLALNLLWLLLFFRNRPWSHALACLVGFFATGLHQPIFHPLFILPFIDLLRQRREWKLLFAYSASYAVIVAFWFAWPLFISSMGSAQSAATQVDANFVDRLAGVLKLPDAHGAWLMASNLVRFIVWQHPLALPLAVFGGIFAWRSEPVVRALTLSILLPIAFFWLLLPWQGHGWGYRYLHPALGSLFLLAGYGWQSLASRSSADLRRTFLWTTAVAVFVLLPMHMLMANRMVRPIAATDRAIRGLPAEVVVLDDKNSDDLAVNRPDLSNRPVRLLSGGLRPDQMGKLCRRGRIVFLDPPSVEPPSVHQIALKRAATLARCEIGESKAEPLAVAYLR